MNDIQKTYKGEFGDECLLFDQNISQSLCINNRGLKLKKMDPDIRANDPDITKDRVYEFLGRYVR